MSGQETTSTRARFWPSTRTREKSNGISSLPRMTFTIGTPPKFLSCSMQPSMAEPGSYWPWPIATRFTISSIARMDSFISATPYVKQTWADGIDEKGRPKVRPGTEPSFEGMLVYPDITGGANWYSPSYSPQTKLFYHTAREIATTYYKGEPEYKSGTAYTAGGGRRMDGDVAFASVKAWEATTGKIKWEFKLLSPPWAGLLSTAGNLVFGGTEEGNFFALDAESGKALWDFQLGGAIRANPISFALDGKQYVAIAAGSALFVFGL